MPLTRNQASAAAQSRPSGTEPAETSMSKDSAEQGGTSSESDPPRRDSPENCSICLGPFINKSFTSSCAHSFCFVCLKQWSKVKAECPLCKQPFTSIFHNIRSNQMYDIYELPRQPPNHVNQYNIYTDYVAGGLTTFAAPTHHYLSLSQPFDADLTLSNFSRFQFRHRRYDRYLNPLSIQGEHPYSFTSPAVNPTAHVSAASWPTGAEDFRREIYRHNLGPPVVISGNENSTYRLTPAMVQASSHRLHRIMPWLTRELRVLLRSHQNVRLAISMIQPLLTQVTIDSVYFHDRVATLIGRRSRVFIQEFLAFANSALSMQAFDRKAMYRRRDESIAASSPSSTSSENDVVEITDVSPDIVALNSLAETQAVSSQPLDLRRSGWDSPTPGPSWSSLGTRDTVAQAVPIDRVSVSSESDDPVFIPQLRDSDSEHSRAGSDIIFVKYDKPWEERSPINLTSNSEKEDETERVRKKKKSKHKKKNREVTERRESVKKDKSHKSSKGKSHREKTNRSSSKGESGEERSTSAQKRLHPSSSEFHKTKRRKRSKDKREREKSSEGNRDRERVDRLFAEAFAQSHNYAAPSEEKAGDSRRNGTHKDRSSRLPTKERSRKKKKSKHRSRDSQSPSYSHSFKKHHSGHKKSSNAALLSQTATGERSNPNHRASSQEGDKGPGLQSRPPRRDSREFDRDPLNQAHSSTSISHPVAPGFQPSYLPMPDTVQHIPVNLWVSTWPALPVSHTYHAPHPSASTNPPGNSHTISQNSSSSFPPATSTHSAAGPSTSALDSHTISSDSSTDSDSDADAPDRQIPSLKNVDSRTMHWLETHCPDLGRLQPSSSSIVEVPNGSWSSSSSSSSPTPSSLSSDDDPGNSGPQPPAAVVEKETEDDHVNVEILSVGSGEEDIVICSSSSDSDPDEIHCVEVEGPLLSSCAVASSSKELEPTPLASCFLNGSEKNTTNTSRLPFLPRFSNPVVHTSTMNNLILSDLNNSAVQTSSANSLILPDLNNSVVQTSSVSSLILPDLNNPVVQTSSMNNLILPSGSKPFQPFKLQKKTALAHQGKDPFFPSISHSSDDDCENGDKPHLSYPPNSPPKENINSSQTSQDSFAPSKHTLSTSDLVPDNVLPSISSPNEDSGNRNYGIENNAQSIDSNGHVCPKNNMEHPPQKPTLENTSSSSPASTLPVTSTAMFSVLPSLPQTAPPVTTVMPSNLNYLPYSTPQASFSPTSVPSYLLQPFPFGIPPPATHPPRLPFSSLEPILTQNPQTRSILPSVYPSITQDATNNAYISPEPVIPGTFDVGSSLLSETAASHRYPTSSNQQDPAGITSMEGFHDNTPDAPYITNQTVGEQSQFTETNGRNYPSRELVDCGEKDVNSVCAMNDKPVLSEDRNTISNHLPGAVAQNEEQESNENPEFSVLTFQDCTDKSDFYETRDFLEPEDNSSMEVDVISTPVKRNEVLNRPELSSGHFQSLLESSNSNSIVDHISNSGDSSAPDILSSDINEQTLSANTLRGENKSVIPLPHGNSEYAMPINIQDSQVLESIIQTNVNTSSESAVDTVIGAQFEHHESSIC